MNNEHELVVKPLIKWFNSQKANWQLDCPKYPTAATGWDLQARRKNQDLLIEAKYITGRFISYFSGMVCAPMSNKKQSFMKRKSHGWNEGVCWAIGTSFKTRDVFQILLDYLSRNIEFWIFYGNHFRMKYIFFISDSKVKKINWTKLIQIAAKYLDVQNQKKLNLLERRVLAAKLMKLT